ncbi:phosphate ABC transporter substrate-binding protein [Mariprofundus sp. EBB-1]|uniref:phosphate ABC transporter substrate-binding protein n=1 Tax=Mariprofundus sp. EBB-1 TaxID=2650971 RepID=UPI000EF1A183|nr:phosphate ABC transporter substrate-binding protein [Mariprofundus sp. EBB-1]RLL51574.1 phosphate ABC transporter substrate-binding protein [Mariprofundus sp. EBB-1]
MKHKNILSIIACAITAVISITPVYAHETLHAMGSTTVMPVVSEAATAFHKAYPDISITVSGGGSGVGIAAMIQHTAQIGMASRNTSPEEQAKLNEWVDNIVIARDAVAVVVSKEVYLGGVTHLSLAQIARIYRGQITNWKQLGGPDAQILAIDKEASRGTRHVFAEAVLGNAHARAPGASLISGSNNEEQAIVARSHQAIGMLSNAWLNDRVRGIAIDMDGVAISPTLEQIRNGHYPISRGLHILIAKDASPAARAFVQFLLSEKGQGIVKKVGYLPVH